MINDIATLCYEEHLKALDRNVAWTQLFTAFKISEEVHFMTEESTY